MGLQDRTREKAMTEDNTPQMEIQVEQGCHRAIARADSWLEALMQARVAELKMRIAATTCHEIGYDFTENRWHLSIQKETGPIRNRISYALLLSFPERISREELESLSSANMASLRNYLTKPELEVQPNIDENEEGIRLNELGYIWATGILNSMEDGNENEEGFDDDE